MNPTLVYLAQTDTTVGFLSQDSKRLKNIKNRDSNKEFIISVNSFRALKTFARVPCKYKKFIRKAKKTTIVYPNNRALRVVKSQKHLNFLNKITWAYTTSSNPSGAHFDEKFATQKADILIYDKYGYDEKTPSKIIKCGKISKRRLR